MSHARLVEATSQGAFSIRQAVNASEKRTSSPGGGCRQALPSRDRSGSGTSRGDHLCAVRAAPLWNRTAVNQTRRKAEE